MKLSVILYGVLYTCMLAVARADDELPTIRVAYFNYPPHIYQKDGRPYGPLADIWNQKMAKYGQFKIKWIGPVPFIRMIRFMENGKVADVWAQLAISNEHEKYFDFSAEPICKYQQFLFVRRDDPLNTVVNASDLNGKVVAELTGGYLPPLLLNQRDKIKFEELSGDTSPFQAVKMLVAGRVWGVYFAGGEVIKYAAAKNGVSGEIKALALPGPSERPCYPAMWKGLDPAKKQRIRRAAKQVHAETWESYNNLIDMATGQTMVDQRHRQERSDQR